LIPIKNFLYNEEFQLRSIKNFDKTSNILLLNQKSEISHFLFESMGTFTQVCKLARMEMPYAPEMLHFFMECQMGSWVL
jgi:hypothetical protein